MYGGLCATKKPQRKDPLGLFSCRNVDLACREQLVDLLASHLVRIDPVVESPLAGFSLEVFRAFTLDWEAAKLILAEVASTGRPGGDLGQTGARKPLTVCGQQAQPDPLGVVPELVALDRLNCVLDCVFHCLVLHPI